MRDDGKITGRMALMHGPVHRPILPELSAEQAAGLARCHRLKCNAQGEPALGGGIELVG